MIKKEFLKIWHNKMLVATLLAISIVPILYAGVFLKSVWDPYGNTSQLPVAVVNNDQSVSFNDQELNVGKEVIDNLKNNDKLNWQFVDGQTARDGLKKHDYYMVVTIPEDFSKNAATVLDADPEKMDLTYETNPGANFISEIIGDSAVKQLKAEVGESVTKAYTTAIFASIQKIGSGMEQAADGASQLDDGSKKLNSGLTELDGKIPILANGVNQLTSGSGQLSEGVSQYTNGVSGVNAGAQQLNGGLTQLADKVSVLGSSAQNLNAGTTQLRDGLAEMNNNIPAEDYAGLANRLDQSASGLEQMASVVNRIPDSQLDQLGNITGEVAALKTGLESVGTDIEAAGNAMDGAIQTTTSIAANAGATAAVKANAEANAEYKQQVLSIINNSGIDADQAKNLTDQVNGISAGIDPDAVANAIAQEVAANKDTIGSDVKGHLENAGGTLKAMAGTKIPDISQDQINTLKGLKSQVASMSGNIAELKQLETVLTGMGAVKEALNTKLVPGANQLVAGTNQLAQSAPQLVSGVSQLENGSQTLASGTNQLNNSSNQLTSGATQLNNGLNQLGEQVPALASGVRQLDTGSKTLADGTTDLATSLTSGAEDVTSMKLTDKNASMVANPDETIKSQYSNVPNYGHALAPYFMSVSLFVGSILFNFAYPIRKIADRKNATATKWFFSKFVVAAITATAMAMIIGGVMQLIGLTVVNPVQYYLTLLATAWFFMYMTMVLAMSFDNPGRFISIILLVLQLGASGGVFPMEITGHFYNVLHPFMPMTYTINGLRQSISNGLGNGTWVQAMVFLIIGIVVLISLLYLAMTILFKRGSANYSQLNDNQKLLDDHYDFDKAKYTLW